MAVPWEFWSRFPRACVRGEGAAPLLAFFHFFTKLPSVVYMLYKMLRLFLLQARQSTLLRCSLPGGLAWLEGASTATSTSRTLPIARRRPARRKHDCPSHPDTSPSNSALSHHKLNLCRGGRSRVVLINHVPLQVPSWSVQSQGSLWCRALDVLQQPRRWC